ncbi:siderophore-iron reductase FhuF [Rhizobium oryzihabitans]|uniref:Siderophore-iron reductase FhuF n=1 Tax=Rhizobium oryzihabitans TaxID=2267833 RepID=A0A7L5BPC9_9HYPH|nr:siderophore-iron reductase FhuF [Rhizobium oryzihabitans]QCM07764.1 siderophore-iron reductase FhuF [Agrobacterium tumefaciens]QIB40747.1 siderophore-iron reductase FhuF [Rhizobium oryzihabitans]CUX53298.1 Ferric iron reductase [Agrobacterium genomosp. 5 str. CFBP 6626]
MLRTEILRCLFEQSTPVGSRSLFQRKRRGDLLLAELLEPRRFERLLRNYGRRHGRDPVYEAVASEWSKRYFASIVKPAVAAAILADWRVPLTPEKISLEVNDDGDIVSVRLSSFGGPVAAASPEERFDFLVRDNLAVVVSAIADASGLSRNVLWSNAGNMFEGTARSCEALLQSRTSGLDHAFGLLETSRLSDGTRNPLHRPIVYPIKDDGPKRLRRVCCIRYLLETLDYCATCPCPGSE